MKDVALWKTGENKYSRKFDNRKTWQLIWPQQTRTVWSRGVWFKYATPKYAFFIWLVFLNRLTTGDNMRNWNVGARTDCVLCRNNEEDRNHLFFSCLYSSQIWKEFASNLLLGKFSTNWNSLMSLLYNSNYDKVKLFLLRYTFQATLYHIWR